MARYELKMYMSNGCGHALLGDVAVFEAPDEVAAMSEAVRRVRRLPRRCFGTLHDAAGVQIWADESSGPEAR